MFHHNEQYHRVHTISHNAQQSDEDNDSIISSKFAIKLPPVNKHGSIKRNIANKTVATQVTPRQEKNKTKRHAKSVLECNSPKKQQQKKKIRPALSPRIGKSKTEKTVTYQPTISRSQIIMLQVERCKNKQTFSERVNHIFSTHQVNQMEERKLKFFNKGIKKEIAIHNEIFSELLAKIEVNDGKTCDKKDKKSIVLQQCVNNNQKMIERSNMELNMLREKEQFAKKFKEIEVVENIEEHKKMIIVKKKQIKKLKDSIRVDSNVLVSLEAPLNGEARTYRFQLREKLNKLREREKNYQRRLQQLCQKKTEILKKVDNKTQAKFQQTKKEGNVKNIDTVKQKHDKQQSRMAMIKLECEKIQKLNEKKKNYLEIENQSLRTNIRNIQSQIKNLEEAIDRQYLLAEQIYEKNQSKKKNQIQILEQMKFYSSQNRKKKHFSAEKTGQPKGVVRKKGKKQQSYAKINDIKEEQYQKYQKQRSRKQKFNKSSEPQCEKNMFDIKMDENLKGKIKKNKIIVNNNKEEKDEIRWSQKSQNQFLI